jgi:hypothetical protein
MLTPVDVHSLVGLLCVPAGPENVEVVLGEDVDVTVTARDKDGNVTAFHGIEVKDHARPLDVADVEQLCAKFKKMPGLTSHAIVSASGYTRPAIRKARHHAVVPWSFESLDDPSKGTEQGIDQVRWFESVGQPEVTFRRVDRREWRFFDENLPVRLHDGSESASLRTVADWSAHVVSSAINRIVDGEEFQPRLSQLTDGHVDMFGSVAVTFEQPLLFGPPENSFAVDAASVTGAIACRTSTTKLDFRVLVEQGANEGDDVPFAGCGIAVLPKGNLVALSTNNIAKTVNVLNVPLTDRLKEQIRLHTIK